MTIAIPALRRSFRTTILLACVFVASPIAAYAQQTCRNATDAARKSITDYLRDPDEHFWLRGHGITSMQVAELQPLTDPADTALCVRMDSTLAPDTAYYFRAGAHIIGTIAKPLVIDQLRMDIGDPIFLFDSVGTWVHSGGIRVGVSGNLRVVSTVNGRVVLAWTNTARAVSSLRLQRGVSGSPFADVGNPLALTATTATDSTAAPGGLYRYRLAAIGVNGDSGQSNVVWAGLADIGTVTRSAAGLLFRDRFNRANGLPGANWVVESGSWAIADSALQITIAPSQSVVIRPAGIANRKDFHVQVTSTRSQLNNYATIYARRSGATMYLADLGSNSEQSGRPRIYRQTGGGYVLLAHGVMTSTVNTPYRLTFSVIGTSLRFYADGERLFSLADATAANNVDGHVALSAYGGGVTGTIRLDDVVVCSGRIVTMSGLPSGYTLRVGGIISGDMTAGGTVSLDLLRSAVPVAQLEILNEEDTLVKTHAPADGVCGGDSYVLTPP